MNLQSATDRYLKLKEVQELLGVSRATLWRWETERGLKVVRVGKVARVRESDLRLFLKRHESANECDDTLQPDAATAEMP